MAIADTSLLNEFIAESREHLHNVENDFIQLETKIDAPDPETLNRIFRAVHTIKGSAGFFGMTSLSELTHSMENVLSRLRESQLTLSADLMDTLLAGIDMLNSMIDDITNSNSIETKELRERLQQYLDPKSLEKSDVCERLGTLISPELMAGISQEALARVPHHGYLYILKYNLQEFEKEDGLSPVALVNELLKMGDILSGVLVVPETDIRKELPVGDLYYTLIYATILEPDLIAVASQLDESLITQISFDALLSNSETVKPVQLISPAKDTIIEETEIIEEIIQPIISADPSPVTNQPAEQSDSRSNDSMDTIRIRVDILDKLMMLAGELVLVRNQQLMHADRNDSVSRTITQRLDVVTTDLQESIMRTRMQPIGNVFTKFNRVTRDLSRKLGKDIRIETIGNEVELDKNIIESLTDPLTHIIRNSCDHGIETPEVRISSGKHSYGTIKMYAYHEGGQINVEIDDDGRGISIPTVRAKLISKGLFTESELAIMSEKEILSTIFLPGFSTVSEVSDLSGRGVGMDVVKTAIERLGGIIEMDSIAGKGTKLRLRLPLTLAIIPSLIVEMKNVRFAIPQINLEEMVCLYDEEILTRIECAGSREVFRLRDFLLPMVRLDEVLDRPVQFSDDVKAEITEQHHISRKATFDQLQVAKENNEVFRWALNFAVLKVGGTRFGLIIDKIIGSEEIVVKPMHRALKDLSIYSGATVLGDGKVALILDALGIARHAAVDIEIQDDSQENQGTSNQEEVDIQSLLLFDNSGEEQFAIPMKEIKRVEKIEMSKIEKIGHREFITIDGASTRIMRLNDVLPLSYSEESKEMFLLLPKKTNHHYGLLMSKLVDIGEFEVELDVDTIHTGAGVLGTALIKEKLTLLLELNDIAMSIEPEWRTMEGVLS